MGAAFGQVCYSSLPLAEDAYFQAVAPVVLPSGVTVSYQTFAGVWMRVEVKANGVVSATVAPLPTLAPCDSMMGFNDGLFLSSAFIVALVSASIYGIISKAK